jgi:hypothetical protein
MPDPILNDTGFTPNFESIPNQPLPSFETFSNPYADLTVTSQPKSAMVGIDSSIVNDRMDFAKQRALSDPYLQAQRFETPKIEGYEAAAGSKYFEQYGVVPGMDVEEFYGSVQTNWDKLSNAFVGAGVLAANQFKEQLLSWGDTASWIGSLGDNSPFKQIELEEINKWQNSFNNKYHIFQTQEDRNTFFNMSNFSNMLQQSGYAIGAVLEMAAEQAALTALTTVTFSAASEIQAARTLQLASKLGKTVERTRQLEKTLQGVGAIRKGFNSVIGNVTNVPFIGNTLSFGSNFNKLRRIDQMTDASTALARTASRGFGAFYRDLRMINAGITEAKATVAPVMEDTYQALMDDYRTAYGLEPDNAKKEEFKNIAFNAVQAEGAKQAVWIALTDKIAFDGILKSFKGSKYLDDGLAAQGIFKNTKSAIAKGEDQFVSKKGYQSFIHQLKVSPVKALTKAPLTYLKTNLMEGVQESGQNIIDEYTKSWTLYNYGSPQQRKEVKDVNDFLLEGAKSQLTMEGTKTFMSGFLTGGILNVMSSGVRGARSLGNQYLNKESYADSKKREEAQKIDIVNTLNDIVNNKGDFYRSMLEANISRETSAKDGNLKEYWDNKNDFLNKYAIQLVKSNLHNVAIDRLQEITTELTPEEFKQAYPSALVDGVSVDEAKLKMNERYEEFKTKLNEVKETYDNIVNNYGNPYNPAKYKKDTPEYKKEVINYYAAQNAIEHISFSKQTYKDIAKRQKEVLNNIKTYIPNMSFTSLYAITSPSFTLEKELELLENEMNTTADEKIKKEKAEKIKLYNTYKKNVETLSEDINNATGNTEKLAALKDKFRTENIDVITELLKTDNSNLTSDAVYNTASDIFDYLHLQSDNETALNNFNIVANPLTYNELHESHVNQIINMQEELEKMNKDAESAETKTAETAKSENVNYILVNDKKARVINAEVSEDGSATIITYVLDGDSIDNEKTVISRKSEGGVTLHNDEDGNLISVEPFVEEVTTSGVFTPTTSYNIPTGPELTTASGTSTQPDVDLGALEKMNLDAERNTLNEIINNPQSTAKQISDAKNRLKIVNKELGITSTADVAGTKSIEDYDQDELFIKSNKLTEEANRQLEEKNQVGPKQVAPAYSIANTTDLYDVITLNNGKKVYQRKSINPNYVFELATQTILPGYSIYYKVITDYSIPYEDKINYAYEKSDIFDQDDKVKSDMYDNARIGIYAKINGKEQLIGSVHTPTWISLKLDDEFRNIAIPQDQINDVLPEVVKQEIENNQTLRKVILDSFNKDPNFIVSGNIESKSIGILKIENKTNKLSDVVNPKLAEGGLNNRHGMFGIVRNGTLQVDYNIESDKIEMSNNFKKNIENYEGSSFLLVPTGTGTYFPVFIKLPKLDNGQSLFILESWKAFTGIENNKELVNAVYKSLGKEEPQGKPDIEILKQYINQYLTMLNSDPLSKIGNGQDVPIGAARLNITSEGTLYLQVNNKDGYFKERYDKSNLPPSNILELMGNLSTTIKFTNPMNKNILGINSILPFDMLSMKDGKLLIEKMTYNQYIMSRVGTHLEKGTNSKNEFNDWVYFANPVIKVNYTEPVFEEPAVSNEVNKEEIEGILNTAPAELTNNADDIFSELDRALSVDSMTDTEVQKNSKKCTGILPDA